MIKDKWSSIINAAGFCFFLAALPPFVADAARASMPGFFIICTAYCAVMAVFWPLQMAYHIALAMGKNPAPLQMIDRSLTLLFLAALLSPALIIHAGPPAGWITTAGLWIAAISGTLIILFTREPLRWIAPVFAFVIGAAGIAVLTVHMGGMTARTGTTFLTGAVLMLAGGVVYAVKKPDPFRDFGFHEVYHTVFTAGAVFMHIFTVSGL
jgi:hemolysin III